jgi:hypothetical protein
VHSSRQKNGSLCVAAKRGRTETVAELLKAGADVDTDDGFALRWASRNGKRKKVELLLSYGASVGVFNNYPLRYACKNGHPKVASLLLDKGADPLALDAWAVTWAARRWRSGVLREVFGELEQALSVAQANSGYYLAECVSADDVTRPLSEARLRRS